MNICKRQFENLLREQYDNEELYYLHVDCPSEIGWTDDVNICESRESCRDCWLNAFEKAKEDKTKFVEFTGEENCKKKK